MPQCGNCGKSVASSDIVCPHCDALLAAYASPSGSGAPTDYAPPPEPPVTEIPAVDLEIPPPSETPVVTNPAEVTEEIISTAPQPLFDTNLTVEAISRAAEGDHSEDVLTLSEKEVRTKKVVFDVPEYARPPADAAPIPIVEDADDITVPLIRQNRLNAENRTAVSVDETGEDASDSDPDPGATGESWLSATSPPPARQKSKPGSQPKKAVKSTPGRQEVSTPPAEVGRTDAYLRKLHEEAGYTPNQVAVSQPVEEEADLTPLWDPNRRIRDMKRKRTEREARAASESIRLGCLSIYGLVVFILWFSVLLTVLGGHFNSGLIFFTIALTIGYKHIFKLVNKVSNS